MLRPTGEESTRGDGNRQERQPPLHAGAQEKAHAESGEEGRDQCARSAMESTEAAGKGTESVHHVFR